MRFGNVVTGKLVCQSEMKKKNISFCPMFGSMPHTKNSLYTFNCPGSTSAVIHKKETEASEKAFQRWAVETKLTCSNTLFVPRSHHLHIYTTSGVECRM